MSHTIINALKSPIDHAFGMIGQYIDVCPENIWVETSGSWPVWQQVYHVINVVNIFFPSSDAVPAKTLLEEKYCGLQAAAPSALVITRTDMQAALAQAMQDIEALLAALDDSELTSRNEGLFQTFGMDMTIAATLVMLASHTMYHLGCCDTALRNHGIPGIF